MALIYNGSQINSLIYNGTETTGVWNGSVVWEPVPPSYTLTLQTDGNGTLTADTITGYPGDTVTLSPTYNTYYRFDNYSNTGGSIDGNLFTFGDSDATVQANFKVNAFTASGGFEQGSNVNCRKYGVSNGAVTASVPAKYATVSYHTSNVPTAWYNTSNRWKVTSTVSAYQITLNPKMYLGRKKHSSNTGNWGGALTALSLIGSTQTQSQSWDYQTSNSTDWTNDYYNKSFTSNTTGVNYGISAKLQALGYYNGAFGFSYSGESRYVATGTTGTWVATGIAP